MNVTYSNKRFRTFPNNDELQKHIIDNRDKIPETSNEFRRSLIKILKIKFLHSMTRSMRMLSIKMRNFKELENYIFNQQSWRFFQSTKQSSGGIL